MAAIIVPAGISGGPYQIVGTAGGVSESTVLFDASGFGAIGSNGITSLTFPDTPINVGSGANGTTNLCLIAALIMMGANGGTSSAASMSWDATGTPQGMTLIPGATIGNGAGGGDIFIFYLMSPTLGAKRFSASWTGANQPILGCASFVSVNQTGGATSFPTVATNTGSGTTASVAISTSPTTRKLFAAFSTPNAFITASGTDIGHNNAGTVFCGAANWDNGTATSMSYTQSSGGFDGVAVAIKGA